MWKPIGGILSKGRNSESGVLEPINCVDCLIYFYFLVGQKQKTEETTDLSGPNPLSVGKFMRHEFGGIWFVIFL